MNIDVNALPPTHELALVRSAKNEWEGMAYVAVHGEFEALAGFAREDDRFRDVYAVLEDCRHNKRCGAIIRTIVPTQHSVVELDPCLLRDLSVSQGEEIWISPMHPSPASSVTIASSSNEHTEAELRRLCHTYLARHPLSPGQKKPIFLFTGEKITLEIVDVQPHPLCIFDEHTAISITARGTEQLGSGLEEIGGLEHVKKHLRERILLPALYPDFFTRHGIRPPRGILLCGPPGCGKTMLAKALASEIGACFLELRGSEVFQPSYGESEKLIAQIFEHASKKAPAIVLIDEIDAIGGARSAMKGELEKRVVTALLTAMDGLHSLGNVIVVATTNMPSALDPALRRPGRLDYEIDVGIPDRAGRLDILTKKTRHMAIHADADLKEIARRTHGFVGADLMLLCREAAFEALTRSHSSSDLLAVAVESDSSLKITQQDFDHALKRLKPSALREFAVEVPSGLGWADIGGLGDIKDTLVQEVIQTLTDPDAFKAVGISPAKGILLYGPPGTGKTLIARIIANEAEANFISIKGPEVLSKWVGESEERIRHLFAKARESSPCIIFFDEIDAISSVRGHTADPVADRLVNQLLTEMDGFEQGGQVCVIAATNRVDTLDPALLRPGRFDYQISVSLPDPQGIRAIYEIHLRNKPLASDICLDSLTKLSAGFSGAQIAEVCRRAALSAFKGNQFRVQGTQITMQHLYDAITIARKTIAEVESPRIGFTANL